MFNCYSAFWSSRKFSAIGMQSVTSSIRVMNCLILIHLLKHYLLSKTLLHQSNHNLFSLHTEHLPVILVTNITLYTYKLVSPLLFVFMYYSLVFSLIDTLPFANNIIIVPSFMYFITVPFYYFTYSN